MKALPYLLLFLVSALSAYTQKQDLKFEHLNTNNGLSQGHVSSILKDKKGFMWFATDEGLNKYDGYRFVVYKHNPEKVSSISNNFVFDVLEDRTENLWIGTASGLDKFDRKADSFVHYCPKGVATINVKDIFNDSKGRMWIGSTTGLYLFDAIKGSFISYRHKETANSISSDFIYRITEDNNGRLWIATQNGLNVLNVQTGQFICYRNEPGNNRSIGTNWIKSVYKDSRGNIWAGTQGNGIALFNPANNSFTNFSHSISNPSSISYNDILSFEEDSKGNLWIGTENGGISVFDYVSKSFTQYQFDINDNSSLSGNSIYCIYRDDIDNLWIGTWSSGINFLPSYRDKFRHFKQVPGNKNSLSNNIILTIAGDSDGSVWIGTDGGGLNQFDKKRQNFVQYRHDNNNKNSISSDYVLSVTEVEPGILLIGYHRGGFDLFNIKTGIFTHHVPDRNNANSLSVLTVNVVLKDRLGLLWLGTWGGGIDVYNRKTKSFTHYKNETADTNSLNNNFIHSMHEDNSGNIWIGTDRGLNVFDRKNNKFIHYANNPRNKKSISHDRVESMLFEKTGNAWIATGGGLNLFDSKTNSFKVYTEKDGLSNNMIRGILEDNKGNLWISSNQGISKFNPRTKACRNYEVSDGLQGNEFKSGCVYKTPEGEMFFGGPNGLNVFYPDSVIDNNYIPPVYITEFQVFNSPVPVGHASTNLLKQHINETTTITLSYKQSVFTFEFSALNFTLPEKNLYAYKLEGFDKEWNYVGHKRTATYTNLDAGEYTFRVIGCNNDGVWNNKGTTVKLIITPPFWLTWWFKTLALVSIVGAVIAFYRFRMRRINSQKEKLEQKVLEQTQQLQLSTEEEKKARLEADEANKAKSVFLATMSHEIRTPMNGVIGMASLLSETSLTTEQQEYTKTISTCGDALLTVINDILDFSKIESGNMELEHRDFDLHTCIEEVLDVFANKAGKQGLDLVYEIDPAIPSHIVGDSLRLRQVLVNLVSNAIKFTEKGEIFIHVNLANSQKNGELELHFQIRDTGIGIPADKMERLFKAFSQVDASTTRKYGGTGLGLIICEKLIGLMGGKIEVESEVGKGTSFMFSIKSAAGVQQEQSFATNYIIGMEGKRVLVVDDNATNRLILKKQLEMWKLSPTLACSAEEALLILAKEPVFDLLLTDMQMPDMDGCQFATIVNKAYPSLPIILLSSVGDERNKKYSRLFKSILTKPIKQEMLCKQVMNELRGKGDTEGEEKTVTQKLSLDFAKEHPLTVLVAEDNLVNQKLALKILSKLGYDADLAVNGKIATEMVAAKKYDLVFMDVQMPELDGLEATRTIRANMDIQPIIVAMTANAMKEDKDDCLKAGMDDFLSKPVKLEEVVNMLSKWSIILKSNKTPAEKEDIRA